MSNFDISTNRIPHGLLEPAERDALEAAAKVPGARREYWREMWMAAPLTMPWYSDTAYRVHLPAAEPPKQETLGHCGKCGKWAANCNCKKQEPKVEYWRHLDIMDLQCKTVEGIIRDHTPSARIHLLDVELSHQAWAPITAAEYEAAKAKASGKHPRQLPCGCIPCICEDPVRCHGCGAVCCEDHKGGKPADAAPSPVPPDAPKPTRIEGLMAEFPLADYVVWAKINELVDAVNEMRRSM